MSLSVKANDESLELRGERLGLILDKTSGAFSLARRDGKIKFGPILFRAGFWPEPKNKKFLLSTVVLPSAPELRESQETPLGKADLISWPISFGPFKLIQEIALFPEEEFALCRVRLENQSAAAIKVDELAPFSYRGAGDGLEMGAGYTVWKFYRLGYQSWSPAGAISLLEPQPRARNFLSRTIGLAPYLWERQDEGIFSSEYMAELVEPELDLACLLGFITSKDQTGVIEAEVKYERFRRFEAIADCEGVELPAGRELASEWVMAMLTDAPRAGQKKYFELWGQAMNARVPKPLIGWCSWYYYFQKISLAEFEKNLDTADKLEPKIDLFQLDDGYQNATGDWLDWSDKFPIDAKALAEKIHGRGFKAGIWLAPFCASITSELYKSHPDWMLKTERGWSRIAMLNPAWDGVIAFALDVTHPEVQTWLRELITRLAKDSGFDFLKLDFIYSAALPGKRHDPSMTGPQALRKGLEIIREAAGEQCAILGCGAPLGPSVGLVDIMRVSQDTDRKWKNLMDQALGIALSPAMKRCFSNSLSRSLTNGRLWTLDPDCLLLSRGKKLTERDLQSQLTLFHLLSGQVFLSEDISRLTEEQMRLFSLVVPVCGPMVRDPLAGSQPIDLFEREFPEQFFKPGSPMSLLALANWSEEEKPCRINLFRFGLNKKYDLFEAWTWQYHGEFEGKFDLGTIAPHQTRYFALTEVGTEPRIIGLDFHLGLGSQGACFCDSGSGKFTLELTIPGKRQGKVWLKFPPAKDPRILEVEFEDQLKREIL